MTSSDVQNAQRIRNICMYLNMYLPKSKTVNFKEILVAHVEFTSVANSV